MKKIDLSINNQLFSRIKNGDRTALNVLFEKHYSSLYFYACKFVSNEQARDIVHDTFLLFWQKRQSIELRNSITSYLFTMVRNSCFREIERNKKYATEFVSVELSLKTDEIAYFDTEAQSIIEHELSAKLNDALQLLPEKCREVFSKSRFDGLKNKEIAEELGISLKAVEKHMTKALKILKSELKDYLPLFLIFFSNYWE